VFTLHHELGLVGLKWRGNEEGVERRVN
jgi:hypothetical protein